MKRGRPLERRAEFGGRDRGVPRCCPGPAPCVSAAIARAADQERCVEADYRTRFESITELKLRRRQLTEDGNVEISGRDLH